VDEIRGRCDQDEGQYTFDATIDVLVHNETFPSSFLRCLEWLHAYTYPRDEDESTVWPGCHHVRDCAVNA
jgi:hypothetical protein